MSPYEIISAKRDGQALAAEAISHFIERFMAGEVTDYQMTAFLMAVYLRGMNSEETAALTRAYIQSGEVVDLSALPGIKVDKHSTGGVGDKVSIILAPLVAALDIPVPMISGRGLGHSGGTLDKLEAIPGFRTDLPISRYKSLLAAEKMALIGQTGELVPADRRIYALRDVTATVACLPLITASIMSKKIAEGIDALVLDVKYGSGAFMKDPADAEALAREMIAIGNSFGKRITAYLTSMHEPLGNRVGNWLEIEECIDCLRGGSVPDLMEVTLTLSAEMVLLGGGATTLAEARQRCEAAIRSGAAFEKLLRICHAQGGDTTVLEHPDRYPRAPHRETVVAEDQGIVQLIDTYEVGMAAVLTGAGRLKSADPVDPQAGLIVHQKLGNTVRRGDPLFEIHTHQQDRLADIRQRLQKAVTIGDTAVDIPPLIRQRITDI